MPTTTRDPRATLIHRIPDDILREIFLRCLSPLNGAVEPSVTGGPLQLSQVCSNWRAVCHEYGRLWRFFSLRRAHFELSLADETQRWLERSKKAPVHFQLVLTSDAPTRIRQLRTCTGQVSGYNRDLLWRQTNTAFSFPEIKRKHQDKLDELLARTPPPPPPNVLSKMLKPTASSITRLVLGNVPIANLVRLPSRIFPNLERLILVITDRLDYWQFDWITYGPVKAFIDCPHLRYVALGRYFREETNDFIQLPLRQLTHLIDSGPFHDTYRHPCSVVARLFSVAIHLRLLHISFEDDARFALPSALVGSCFTWRSIESLSIESAKHAGLASIFFLTFAFPNLRTLRFTGPVDELTAFLAGEKGVQLEHVSLLESQETPPLDFLRFLSQHAPRLRSLEIAHPTLENLFEGLNSTPPILPNLQILSISCGPLDSDTNEQSLLEKIRNFFDEDFRKPHRQHFRTIKVFNESESSPLADVLFDCFRACSASAGVEVEIALERVGGAHNVVDPLLLDPALAGWEGLRELCGKGRDKTFLYSQP